MGEFKKIDEIGKVPVKKGREADSPYAADADEADRCGGQDRREDP